MSSSLTAIARIANVSKRRLKASASVSLRRVCAPISGSIQSFLSSSLNDMSYKKIVLNYIKTHDVTYFLRTNIED